MPLEHNLSCFFSSYIFLPLLIFAKISKCKYKCQDGLRWCFEKCLLKRLFWSTHCTKFFAILIHLQAKKDQSYIQIWVFLTFRNILSDFVWKIICIEKYLYYILRSNYSSYHTVNSAPQKSLEVLNLMCGFLFSHIEKQLFPGPTQQPMYITSCKFSPNNSCFLWSREFELTQWGPKRFQIQTFNVFIKLIHKILHCNTYQFSSYQFENR